MKKNQRGITLITLTITLVVMSILIVTISLYTPQYTSMIKKSKFESDINKIQQAMTQYYAKHKKIPIRNPYTNVSMLDNIKNPNDNDRYYIIDLYELDLELNLDLNYGKEWEKYESTMQEVSEIIDVYIVNEASHTVYYPKGMEYHDKIHYGLMQNYTKIELYSYDKPYIPTGFQYKEGSWNDGFTIIGDTESTGNEFVWVPCVTNQSKVKEGDTVVTFGKTLPTTTEATDPYYKYNQSDLDLLPTNTTVAKEDSSVQEIETSVATYGGFYIAKYEAGIEGTTENASLTTKTVTDGSVKPLSQSGKGVWNSITRTDAITVSKAMLDQTATGVKSTLISGAAWDTTLQWMVNASDNKTANAGYDTNSAGKGWYIDRSNSIRHLTGYYAVNNIYDMAGNVWDWTTENCTNNASSCVVLRGGNYVNTGSSNPAAYRYSISDDEGNNIGYRVLLYK